MRSSKASIGIILYLGLFLWTSMYLYQGHYECINGRLDNLNIFRALMATNHAPVANDHPHADINLTLFRNATIIFYNRVPKCASTTTFTIISELSKKNNFYYKRMSKFPRKFFYSNPKDEVRYVDSEFEKVKGKKALLQEHVYFKDFNKTKVFMNRTLPIYINLIRDPLDRLQSWYYFIRYQPTHIREMSKEARAMSYSDCVKRLDHECTHSNSYMAQIAFFCGAMPFCRLPEMGALQQAKRNVVRHYAVVGMMEELRDFFVALEWALPSWFTGAVKVYDKMDAKNASVVNKLVNIPHSRTLDPESQEIMKKLLKEDYDFYYFIKQRFDFYMKQIKQEALIKEQNDLKNSQRGLKT